MDQESTGGLPRGVIGVPGTWADHQEVVDRLASSVQDYAYSDGQLTHTATQRSFVLEEYEFEPRMREAFVSAGAGRIPEKDLDRIADHCRTLYISAHVGSVDTTRSLMLAVDAVLQAGGLGVKVESSGVAHPASLWPLLCEDQEASAALHAMVAFVGEGSRHFSCGMHHFGLRDVVVSDQLSPEEAGRLMEGFCGYQMLQEREMLNFDTFSLSEDAPRYSMCKRNCNEFAASDLFFNSYGVWELTPQKPSQKPPEFGQN